MRGHRSSLPGVTGMAKTRGSLSLSQVPGNLNRLAGGGAADLAKPMDTPGMAAQHCIQAAMARYPFSPEIDQHHLLPVR